MSEIRVVAVRPGGEVPGIQVAGFNGEVDPLHTPALRAPVLVDDTGALVSLLPLPMSRENEGEGQVRVRIERGARLEHSGDPSRHETRFAPLTARLGYTVTILGEDERRAAPLLRDRVTGDEFPSVSAFMAWLARGCLPPVPTGAQQIERLVVWYSSEEEIHALWQHIQEEARRALFAATARGQAEEMVRMSWWLSRAAFTDEDLYLAAAGLKSGGSEDAEGMLESMLEEPPRPAVLKRKVQQALRELEECARIAAVPVQTSSKSSPVLASHRKAARQQLGLIKSRAVNS
jgi:hypothetical protein